MHNAIADPGKPLLLLRIAAYDVLLSVPLAFCTPRQLLSFVESGATAGGRSRPAPDEVRIRRIVAYTDRLVRGRLPVLRGACYKRSLILFHFLGREGLPVRFHVGMRQEDGEVLGHAWLSLEGRPCFESHGFAERYTPVYAYPEQSAEG